MVRSSWKGPFIDKNTVDLIKKNIYQKKSCTVKRSSEIMPWFLDKTVKIHNGKKLTSLQITNEMIGHKFGEFSFTRVKNIYKNKKKKKKRKK